MLSGRTIHLCIIHFSEITSETIVGTSEIITGFQFTSVFGE